MLKLRSIANGEGGAESAKDNYPRLKHLKGLQLKQSARLVFAALCEYANRKNEKWPAGIPKLEGFAAWPSVHTITQVTGLSDRGVQRGLRELEKRKVIQRLIPLGEFKRGAHTVRTDTNCYLLTPDRALVKTAETEIKPKPNPLYIPETENELLTADSGRPPPDLYSGGPRHHVTPPPDSMSPKETNSSSSREETKKEFRAQKPLRSLSDDDDGRTKRPAPLVDPREELHLLLEEHFGSRSATLLEMILADISPHKAEIQEFLAFYEARTGSPRAIKNPGAYCRTLIENFHLAKRRRVEAKRLDLQRELERRSEKLLRVPEEPECVLGVCNGHGEVYDATGRIVTACECEAGQTLPPKVLEMIEQMQNGAAES
jgi:Helix-turn-helix domain